jgi:hypothetical protein
MIFVIGTTTHEFLAPAIIMSTLLGTSGVFRPLNTPTSRNHGSRAGADTRRKSRNSKPLRHATPPAKSGGLNWSMQHHLIGIIFLKVVFMAQGRRDRLSAERRTEMWTLLVRSSPFGNRRLAIVSFRSVRG